MAEPVYNDLYIRRVPSGHGEGINYYVTFGTVNWLRQVGAERRAVVVRMEYPGAGVANQMPAHILDEDLPHVLAAIEEVCNEERRGRGAARVA
jgi:hypothetical protein